MSGFGKKLQEWRTSVKHCRRCRLLPNGKEINPLDPGQLCNAQIRFETSGKTGYRSGWATAMLDKNPNPAYSEGLLEASCSSGILVLLEAPNHDDTYCETKGYITCDPDTDETGSRLFRLLSHIGVRPEQIVFANTVQCLPPKNGNRSCVTPQQRLNCRDHLLRLLAIVNPKAVLAFGNEAIKECDRFMPIKIDGKPLRKNDVNARKLAGQCIEWASTRLVPLYHPSPLVVANARRKDGTPGTGCSEEDQMRHISTVSSILSGS